MQLPESTFFDQAHSLEFEQGARQHPDVEAEQGCCRTTPDRVCDDRGVAAFVNILSRDRDEECSGAFERRGRAVAYQLSLARFKFAFDGAG